MKKMGYLLITLSFLAASLVAVQEVLTLNWNVFIPIVLAGFVGVAMVRFGHRQETQSVDRVADNIGLLHRSLENVVQNLQQLIAQKEQINTYDVRHKIDELLVEDLDNFAEARESIGHKYGLQHYADVMSHFAAGERYLNRVWSSSADGYIDEVNTFLDRALEELGEAFQQLKRLEAGGATAG